MEYCVAGSLCDLMAITDRTLSEEQIASVLKMSLQGLAYFHSLNHLHRDVKSVDNTRARPAHFGAGGEEECALRMAAPLLLLLLLLPLHALVFFR